MARRLRRALESFACQLGGDAPPDEVLQSRRRRVADGARGAARVVGGIARGRSDGGDVALRLAVLHADVGIEIIASGVDAGAIRTRVRSRHVHEPAGK